MKSLLEFSGATCYDSRTPEPEHMKYLLILPLIGLALAASSCRTSTPIDPMNGKPSDRCLPAHTGTAVHHSSK